MMSNPLRPKKVAMRAIAGRPRVVALIVAVSAIGMAMLLVAVSFALRFTVSSSIAENVEQEAGEVERFAASGVDPATGEAFASGARFVEVFLERQVAEPEELIIGGVVGQPADQPVAEQIGSLALSYQDLDGTTRTQIQAPGSSGTTKVADVGTVTWRNIVVDAPENKGFIAIVAFHAPDEQEARGQLLILAALALLALAATGLVAWWASGLVLAHTREFHDAVDEAVERRGIPRLVEEGSPEYLGLAESANRLVERAEVLVEREHRNTEDITHELRTPLAVLEDGLSKSGQTPEELEATRRQLLAEVRRLRLFVTDLVTMNRAERAGYVRPVTIVNAVDLAEEAVAEWEDRRAAVGERDEDGVRVVLGESDVGLLVQVDPPRIRQALDALIANARKASEPGTWVTVGARRSAGADGEQQVSLQVIDAGRGIPEDERQIITQRFVRASNDPAPGAGMGMPLAELLAHAHGGELRIEDHGEYPGMTVSIDLPLHLPGAQNER